ncbi:MAG TPA: three-Cys-motif partner protein TcmP [Thermoanaerobaculia bacterium]|jgi:three-Cys-motif partner protein|nr:three-Cys-motif partner protein TcmP [Thermoanaerobaculia bacterium]
MLPLTPWYDGREQSYLKHYVLSEYLLRFGPIIGSQWRTINYIDSFAGPWEHRDAEYRDTSFGIAVECFREARARVREMFGRDLRVRCRFLEKGKSAFEKLDVYAQSLSDIEARALNTEFEAAVPNLLAFASEPRNAFTFLFVDPKGWSGFSMDVIAPILQLPSSEVLINFMTGHVRRFLEDEKSATSFVRLFGRDIRDEFAGLTGDAREERAIREYMRSVKRTGRFLYVGSAIVFKPEIETPHFHLMYGTRDNKGVKVFKEVEEKLFGVTREVRAVAKERRRVAQTSQASMFAPSDMHKSTALDERRSRYLRMAKARVEQRLVHSSRIEYDKVWRIALAYPLVWESDLKTWIAEWKAAGQLRIPTLTGRRSVPQLERDVLEWIAPG